ncbi:MAG: hypothetical protein ACREYF_08180 [Gammaproteobacteria bacterium]
MKKINLREIHPPSRPPLTAEVVSTFSRARTWLRLRRGAEGTWRDVSGIGAAVPLLSFNLSVELSHIAVGQRSRPLLAGGAHVALSGSEARPLKRLLKEP